MTDYSDIVADYSDTELQRLLSSCTDNQTPYDRAMIQIDEDGKVCLYVRTYYSSQQATPMDVWHRKTNWWDIVGGTDATWLREELGEGGEMSGLIDRIIAGHELAWDGNNYVGRFDEDATDATEMLMLLLGRAPTSNIEVWSAESWLTEGTGMSIVELAEMLKDETPASLLDQAERGSNILIGDGIDGMERALDSIMERAKEEVECDK